MLIKDPKTIGLAILGGVIPAGIWLWFWLKESRKKSEPIGLIIFCFILGMISVVFVLPIEKFLQKNIQSSELQIISWATAEELIKYLIVLVIISKTKYLNRPIDWPIFMITAALGFAAFENALFLIEPITLGQTVVGLLTGQLRFLGSTLLHAVSSGIIGISLGLSFYMTAFNKKLYLILGILSAIFLHSTFNFFIMNNSGSEFIKILAFLWVATIINLLLFEKLRRMSGEN
ncbi:MAG: PrsW family glutamic-type intramembrane protease [Patescibacteria group bacterium]